MHFLWHPYHPSSTKTALDVAHSIKMYCHKVLYTYEKLLGKFLTINEMWNLFKMVVLNCLNNNCCPQSMSWSKFFLLEWWFLELHSNHAAICLLEIVGSLQGTSHLQIPAVSISAMKKYPNKLNTIVLNSISLWKSASCTTMVSNTFKSKVTFSK